MEEFMEPIAEMTMARVIHVAVPRPATCSTTSEAMCWDEATALNGSTFRQAALNSKLDDGYEGDAADKCAGENCVAGP